MPFTGAVTRDAAKQGLRNGTESRGFAAVVETKPKLLLSLQTKFFKQEEMMKKHILPAAALLIAATALLGGCTGQNSRSGIEVIDLYRYKDGGALTDAMLDSLATETRVIGLMAEGDLTIPANPVRIKFAGDITGTDCPARNTGGGEGTAEGRIYVLDNPGIRTFQMLAFDSDGKLIKKIGGPGRGPGEYFVLTDFAVAPDGSLWINDAGMDNMLHYSSSLEYIDTYPMPYDIDNMEFLENGEVLVNVSQWDSTQIEIAVTDTMFRYDGRRELLRYSHSQRTGYVYTFGDGSLIRTQDGYLHCHPIDPDIYLIDDGTGEILRHYRVDFGPDALTHNDISSLGDNDDRYIEILCSSSYLYKIFTVTDRYILGQAMRKGEYPYFLADLDTETVYWSSSDSSAEGMSGILDCRDGWLISTFLPDEPDAHYRLILRKFQ